MVKNCFRKLVSLFGSCSLFSHPSASFSRLWLKCCSHFGFIMDTPGPYTFLKQANDKREKFSTVTGKDDNSGIMRLRSLSGQRPSFILCQLSNITFKSNLIHASWGKIATLAVMRTKYPKITLLLNAFSFRLV